MCCDTHHFSWIKHKVISKRITTYVALIIITKQKLKAWSSTKKEIMYQLDPFYCCQTNFQRERDWRGAPFHPVSRHFPSILMVQELPQGKFLVTSLAWYNDDELNSIHSIPEKKCPLNINLHMYLPLISFSSYNISNSIYKVLRPKTLSDCTILFNTSFHTVKVCTKQEKGFNESGHKYRSVVIRLNFSDHCYACMDTFYHSHYSFQRI